MPLLCEMVKTSRGQDTERKSIVALVVSCLQVESKWNIQRVVSLSYLCKINYDATNVGYAYVLCPLIGDPSIVASKPESTFLYNGHAGHSLPLTTYIQNGIGRERKVSVLSS